MRETCQFCGLHPYEYVDVGVGHVPIAENCCQARFTWSNWDTASIEQKLWFYGETTERQLVRWGADTLLRIITTPARIRQRWWEWRHMRCQRCGTRQLPLCGSAEGFVCFDCREGSQ